MESVKDEDIEAALGSLVAHYEQSGRSFTIVERSSGWRLCALGEFGEWCRALYPGRKPSRLSGPALETLAIIAYRQPITKSAIEAVRGVSVDAMVQQLLDRNLLKIDGRADLPGRPLLYSTTDIFLDHFGIRHLDDLPNAAELRRVKLPTAEEPAAPASAEGASTSEETAAKQPDAATPELLYWLSSKGISSYWNCVPKGPWKVTGGGARLSEREPPDTQDEEAGAREAGLTRRTLISPASQPAVNIRGQCTF